MQYEYDFNGNQKFKTQTIKLGSKVKGEVITEAEITFENDIEGQVAVATKGNDVIITAYGKDANGDVNYKKILGKITLKNLGTQDIVEKGKIGDYTATLATDILSGGLDLDLFSYQYSLGNALSTKAQKLTGTYLDESINGGDGDDTIKAVGGTNAIVGGKGDDKMYSGEGIDHFIIGVGDAAKKNGDIIYNSDSNDTLTLGMEIGSERSYSKVNNNLVINQTTEDVKDKVTIDSYFAAEADDRINGINLEDEIINIEGNAKKANVLVGTEYNDSITGGNKDDIISTGEGNDQITLGKGQDLVNVDGKGIKLININGGDGAKSIAIDSGLSTTDTAVGAVFMPKDENDEIEYSYKKELNNLVVYANHSDGTTDSIEVSNFFGLITGEANDSVAGKIIVNGETVADVLADPEKDASVSVEGVKVSAILNNIDEIVPGIGALIESLLGENILNKIKLPAGIKNAEVYLGSKYDDLMVGSTNKDVMASFGGDNSFVTGTKGQTVIASIGEGENDNDNYTVSSFEAGTVIYDKDGKYDLTVNGVNTNDIHMVSLSGIGLAGIADYNLDSAEYLTDSKGISNIQSIDYKGLYNKVKNAIADVQEHPNNLVKTINYLLNLASGVIDKYRGLAIAAGNEGYELKDIAITDKNGNDQIISKESQEAVQDATIELIENYMEDVAETYQVAIEGETSAETAKNFGELLLNPTAEKFWVDGDDISKEMKKFYTVVDKENNMYALNNTGCKAISNNLFAIFQNSYVGTSGDNSYVITNSIGGAVIASGKGNDSFTFKGDLGTGDKPVYAIASTLDAGEKDTIDIKNYSFSDLSLVAKDSIIKNGENVALEGITMIANNYKKNTAAAIGYQFGEEEGGRDITDSVFDGLTIKDSKNTYNFTAEHQSEEDIEYDWSEDTNNHYAVTVSTSEEHEELGDANVSIISNDKNNIISNYSNGRFHYTYGQGNDIVSSNYQSNDTYNVDLNMKGNDFKANLIIQDEGKGDFDILSIANEDVSNLRLYFNVENEGEGEVEVDDTISIISKANLDKGKASFNFVTDTGLDDDDDDIPEIEEIANNDEKDAPEIVAVAKNGITFDYDGNQQGEGIEWVMYGEGHELAVDDIIDQVKEQVAAWFENSTKDYASVDDVLNRGTGAEIKEVLAIYDQAYVDNVIDQELV